VALERPSELEEDDSMVAEHTGGVELMGVGFE
jgi:hypothetical protein